MLLTAIRKPALWPAARSAAPFPIEACRNLLCALLLAFCKMAPASGPLRAGAPGLGAREAARHHHKSLFGATNAGGAREPGRGRGGKSGGKSALKRRLRGAFLAPLRRPAVLAARARGLRRAPNGNLSSARWPKNFRVILASGWPAAARRVAASILARQRGRRACATGAPLLAERGPGGICRRPLSDKLSA
jgi:hypothetical protein